MPKSNSTRAHLLSPEEGSCYILSTRNNCCESLASYDVIFQSDFQPYFSILVWGTAFSYIVCLFSSCPFSSNLSGDNFSPLHDNKLNLHNMSSIVLFFYKKVEWFLIYLKACTQNLLRKYNLKVNLNRKGKKNLFYKLMSFYFIT